MSLSSDPVLTLDLGPSAVRAAIGHPCAEGIEIVATASVPSRGLSDGEIGDCGAVAAAVREAVADVQRQAGCEVTSAVVSIDGARITTITSHGMVAVIGERVEPRDVERVKIAAGVIDAPADREVIEVDPMAYSVDDHAGIPDPTGMAGRLLELEARVVTASRAAVARVVEVCKLAGVEVARVAWQPIPRVGIVVRRA